MLRLHSLKILYSQGWVIQPPIDTAVPQIIFRKLVRDHDVGWEHLERFVRAFLQDNQYFFDPIYAVELPIVRMAV